MLASHHITHCCCCYSHSLPKLFSPSAYFDGSNPHLGAIIKGSSRGHFKGLSGIFFSELSFPATLVGNWFYLHRFCQTETLSVISQMGMAHRVMCGDTDNDVPRPFPHQKRCHKDLRTQVPAAASFPFPRAKSFF